MSAFSDSEHGYHSEVCKVRNVSESADVDVLSTIYEDSNNMAVWQRSLSSECAQTVNSIIHEMPSLNIKERLRPDNADAVVANALKSLTTNTQPFSNDVTELVEMFCCLFDLKEAGFRLSVLGKAMCPRFHVDHVPCRLVTTYAGVGTQWLAHERVDRSKLGVGSNGLPDEESGLFPQADDVQNINTGHVALLKGESWAGNEKAGLVHRSPTPKVDEKRLFLTLDFVF